VRPPGPGGRKWAACVRWADKHWKLPSEPSDQHTATAGHFSARTQPTPRSAPGPSSPQARPLHRKRHTPLGKTINYTVTQAAKGGRPVDVEAFSWGSVVFRRAACFGPAVSVPLWGICHAPDPAPVSTFGAQNSAQLSADTFSSRSSELACSFKELNLQPRGQKVEHKKSSPNNLGLTIEAAKWAAEKRAPKAASRLSARTLCQPYFAHPS